MIKWKIVGFQSSPQVEICKMKNTQDDKSYTSNLELDDKKMLPSSGNGANDYKGMQKHNGGSVRSTSVPAVVHDEDISVKTIPSKNTSKALPTKMRVLITSCDDDTGSKINRSDIAETARLSMKLAESAHMEAGQNSNDGAGQDSLEESEESDWFNSDLSTPEYQSRRNSYTSSSKRSSLEGYGDISTRYEPWPVNLLFPSCSATPIFRPFSPTFGGRDLFGSRSPVNLEITKSSKLKVPSAEDNVTRLEVEDGNMGTVELRPVSTNINYTSCRRRSTSSLHVLQARWYKFGLNHYFYINF